MGRIVYSAPRTWSDYAESFKRYVMDNNAHFSNRLNSRTKKLVAGKTDRLEILDTIVTYVQEEVDTDGGSDVGNFAKILKTGKGNQISNTALARKMLSSAGIKSSMVLIHSAVDGYFDPSFISTEQLYIPAVLAQVGGRDYYVFPYMEGLPIDHLPKPLQGQSALVIRDDGTTRLTETPRGNLAENDTTKSCVITLDEKGGVNVTETITLRGSSAYMVRDMLKQLKDDERNEVLEELISYSEGELEVKSKVFKGIEDRSAPMIAELTYRIDNLVTITPDEVLFDAGGLLSPLSKSKTGIDPNKRQNPIFIPYDEQYHKEIKIRFPENWTLTGQPEAIDYSNLFGSIKNQSEVANNELVLNQKLDLKKSLEPKEKIEELLMLTGQTSAFQSRTWSLNGANR